MELEHSSHQRMPRQQLESEHTPNTTASARARAATGCKGRLHIQFIQRNSNKFQKDIFLARVFDKVLNSSEHFWIVTVSTAHARRKHDLITAHCEFASFLSMLQASRCTCIFCCEYLVAVRQCCGPAGALAFSEQVKCTK